jgi:hypothetical protein
MSRPEPLPLRIKFAIAALWLHVVLSLWLLLAATSTPRDGSGTAGTAALLALFAAAMYCGLAIALQRRIPWARGAAIAWTGLGYLVGLGSGRVISSVLLILVPLILPGLPDPVTLGRRPVSGGLPHDYWD